MPRTLMQVVFDELVAAGRALTLAELQERLPQFGAKTLRNALTRLALEHYAKSEAQPTRYAVPRGTQRPRDGRTKP